MAIDNLALDAITLPTMTGAAHARPQPFDWRTIAQPAGTVTVRIPAVASRVNGKRLRLSGRWIKSCIAIRSFWAASTAAHFLSVVDWRWHGAHQAAAFGASGTDTDIGLSSLVDLTVELKRASAQAIA